MKKKALVVTYFGELPFWFSGFQQSCKYNPEITWIIFTDSFSLKENLENLIFINLSIDQFSEIASQKIGIKINLLKDNLYKICDFKPAFGLIYEDYLKEYDFWGHCDLDIIWGRIDRFLNEELFERYDIITSRFRRISGHFCLYRNTADINNIFLNAPGVATLLQDFKRYQKLDEEIFSQHLNVLTNTSWFSMVKRFVKKEKIPSIYWDRILTTSGKKQRELIMDNSKSFKWSNGMVYDAEGKELMYIHFHILKNISNFIEFNIHDYEKEIFISPAGIKN